MFIVFASIDILHKNKHIISKIFFILYLLNTFSILFLCIKFHQDLFGDPQHNQLPNNCNKCTAKN